MIWRFDSGLVVTGVPDSAAADDADAGATGGHRTGLQRNPGDAGESAASLRRATSPQPYSRFPRPEPRTTITIPIG